jgi:hypothetical protein
MGTLWLLLTQQTSIIRDEWEIEHKLSKNPDNPILDSLISSAAVCSRDLDRKVAQTFSPS